MKNEEIPKCQIADFSFKWLKCEKKNLYKQLCPNGVRRTDSFDRNGWQ